jgi:hypothetical protein
MSSGRELQVRRGLSFARVLRRDAELGGENGLRGGEPEHDCAWRRAPLLGKGKVHFGHILNSLTQSHSLCQSCGVSRLRRPSRTP